MSGRASEERRVPGLARRPLEATAPVAGRRHAQVEHGRVRPPRAARRACLRVGAKRGLHAAARVAPVDARGAAEERRAERGLERLQAAEEAVDGAAGRTRGGLIYADGEKPVVAPVARRAQRLAVRGPAVEELV